jgi:putative ATP-dependent endonuclease of OLD family
MGRVKRLIIEGYRSIDSRIEIEFPEDVPLVLIGENNAGKSNIVRALDLLLGERWPGNYDPDDHDFFGRNRENGRIEIAADVDGVVDRKQTKQLKVAQFVWKFSADEQRPFRVVYADGNESPYVSNEVSEQCLSIIVSADRRISQELSFASRYTLLSRLTKKFHKALTYDENRVMELQRKLQTVSDSLRELPEFANFLRALQHQVSEFSGAIEYALGIDFASFDPSNYFRSLRVQPVQGNTPRTFEELGTGQEQILAICLAYAYATTFYKTDGLLLAIEEPEAHLHPLAQRWVAQKLKELAQQGVQVLVTTHSPAFLDVMGLPGWVRVYKEAGATKVTQLTAEKLATYCQSTGAARATAQNVLPFYAAGATEDILAGMFARKVLLVEGPSEALALPVYLTKVGLNLNKEGIAVIPVGGKRNLARWWRLFTAFRIPCYVSFDNDRNDGRHTEKTKDLLRAIDYKGDYTPVLTTEFWEVTSKFMVFGTDFEHCMRRYFDPSYSQLEGDARREHDLTSRESKPLVARYVAERLDIKTAPEGLHKLAELAQHLRALALPEQPFVTEGNSQTPEHEQSAMDDYNAASNDDPWKIRW